MNTKVDRARRGLSASAVPVMAAVALGAMALGAVTIPALAAAREHPAQQGWSHRARVRDPFMAVVRKVGLTAEQRMQLRTLLTAARDQDVAARKEHRTELHALIDPGDPGHAAAVQSAERAVTERFEQRDAFDQKVYALLTTQQRQQLTARAAQMASHGPGREAGRGYPRHGGWNG